MTNKDTVTVDKVALTRLIELTSARVGDLDILEYLEQQSILDGFEEVLEEDT